MATSNITTKCCTCHEEITTFICTGCSKHFCVDDLLTHREELKTQFHEIEHQRNEFMQILNDHNNCGNNHPLIEQINRWEQLSILKIQKTAQEQRNLLHQSIHQHSQQIQENLNTFTQQMKQIAKKNDFNEMILNKLQKQLDQLKLKLNQPTDIEIKEDLSSTFIQKLSIIIKTNSTEDEKTNFHRVQLKSNLKWKQRATAVADGNRKGDKLNQLACPYGIYVDHQLQSIYIADYENHRIVKWKLGEQNGEIVAEGNGQRNIIDQLNGPTDVIVDQKNKSLIICDMGNRRVVRWSLENRQDKQIIIENIGCCGLMMNQNGDLFVSDYVKCEVKKWRKGEKEGTIVAGGNGKGDQLNQLNGPTYIFVDREETVYVSDQHNHRVMKWMKGAKEGIVVAGEHGEGNSLKQLSFPHGLIVNEVGDVYVADYGNNRIMCWSFESKEGHVVVGGKGAGEESNQLNGPRGLSFDVENNLYIADWGNHRIQRFEVDQN